MLCKQQCVQLSLVNQHIRHRCPGNCVVEYNVVYSSAFGKVFDDWLSSLSAFLFNDGVDSIFDAVEFSPKVTGDGVAVVFAVISKLVSLDGLGAESSRMKKSFPSTKVGT